MRTIIIGAVALGATCAARLKRIDPKHEVILLDKGEYASFAHCGLPYYIGNEVENEDKLVIASKSVFVNRFNIDLRLNQEAVKIDPANKKVFIKNHITEEEYYLTYDNLVLAMGATAVKPNFPGIVDKNIFYLKNIDDAIELKDKLVNFKKVAVVGGGFIGLEAMEALTNNNLQVELIDEAKTITSLDYDMAKIVEKLIKSHGVKIHTETKIVKITRSVEGLTIKTNKEDILVDAVVMAIGVKPNVKIAEEAGIILDSNGCIKVDDYLRTNFDSIYAGGDLVSNYDAISNHLVYAPFSSYATKHARIIANNIKGYKYKRPKVTLATVLKLWDHTISTVGLNISQLEEFKLDYNKLYQCTNSHAKYYQNVSRIDAKILYDHEGKILGAQMIGKENVEKRIDELSSLMIRRCTHQDLMELEASYAPPYNTPKSINNYFGYMIDNELNYGIKSISPLELNDLVNPYILDVRSPNSYNKGHIENCIHLPINLLRDHLDDLPRNKPIYIYCNTGLTSYHACCILKSLGFDPINVSGGYMLYSQMID